MIYKEQFLVLLSVFDHKSTLKHVYFWFDFDTIQEYIGVFEADNFIFGWEEASFQALDEVEIVEAWCDHICVNQLQVINIEDGGWGRLVHG